MGLSWRLGWMRYRTVERRGALAIVLVLGISGGVVLAAIAGARRTDTAFERMLTATAAEDVLISPSANTGLDGFYDDIRALRGVVASAEVVGYNLAPTQANREVTFQGAFCGVDGALLRNVARPMLLAGRTPDPDEPREILVNESFADGYDLRVGSTIPMQASTVGQDVEATSTVTSFTVTGIARFPGQVVPVSANDTAANFYVTPAYHRELGRPEFLAFSGLMVRLADAADGRAFAAAAEDVAARHPETGGQVFVQIQQTRDQTVARAIHPQAVALQGFAALAAVLGLLIVTQAIARRMHADADRSSLLRAIGATRRVLIGEALVWVTAVAVAAAVVAVGVAVLLSPLMPVGPARLAEPSHGFELNVAVLGIGALLIVAATVVGAAWPARQTAQMATTQVSASLQPSRLATAGARLGATLTLVTGLRFALERARSRRSTPVQGAIVGISVAVLALSATAVFATNVERLLTEPRLFGQTWDVSIDGQFNDLDSEALAEVAAHDPSLEAYAGGVYGEIEIGGVAVPAVGLDPMNHDVFPTLLSGRAPTGPDEIVLGAKTRHRLAADERDGMIEIVANGETQRVRIVGTAVFPALGQGTFTPTALGDGAAVRASVLEPDAGETYTFFLLRYASGADIPAKVAALHDAAPSFGGDCGFVCVFHTSQQPGDITNFRRVRSTPIVLALLLVAVAIGMMWHALAVSVAGRRRDIAILRTIGFTPRQVAGSISWQASTMLCSALAVGLLPGILAGRWAWAAIATTLGVPTNAAIPAGVLVVGIPSALLVGLLCSALPGRSAGRSAASVALAAN
ncbi:MAG: FtsX-like permease family protein [Microthrixaceae bacterium]